MPAALVFISLLASVSSSSSSSSSPAPVKSPWLVGRVSSSSIQGFEPQISGDLDPVSCASRCLAERYKFAALSSGTCYCGNQLHGLLIPGCFSEETKDVTGGSKRQSSRSTPVGDEQDDIVALHRPEGPFLHNVTVSVSAGRIQAGRAFLVRVCGRLAGRPEQPSGMLSFVTVKLLEKTSRGQSSRRVRVLEDGSFSVSSDWMLESSGNYIINISVSQAFSRLSSTLQLSVTLLPQVGLAIALLHGPQGVPSSPPHLGEPVRLQVCVRDGLAARWITDREEILQGGQVVCISTSGCVKSSLNLTLDAEGFPMVSLNASSDGRWTQETVNVVAHPVVSDLRLNLSTDQLTAGGEVSVDVELFTSMKHLLVSQLKLKAECIQNCKHYSTEKDCNHGNLTNNSQQRDNNLSHLLRACDPSSCYLHLQLHLHLPVFTEERCLKVSVCSISDPPSILLSSAVLPQTLNEPTCTLRFSNSWKSAASPHTNVWSIGLDAAAVNLTTPLYTLLVHSQSSLETQILLQEPAGGPLMDSDVSTNPKGSLLLSTTAASNVTVFLLANATVQYRNSSCTAGARATVVLLFDRSVAVFIELHPESRVSSQSKSVRMRAEGKRKPQDKIHSSRQPPTSQSPAHDEKNKAVSIHAKKQAYPTNTDIIFTAVADVPDPVEFFWDFGDFQSVTTTSRTITKRYQSPGSYSAVVVASWGQTDVTSDVFTVTVQRAVRLNRLVHQPLVLQNQTVTVSCLVSVGTNLTFMWSFGEGKPESGRSTAQHVFHRLGEFTIKVTVSNLISSASLSSHIFVVEEPCQPPPVKNMGPLKLQVRRYEAIRLGVTFETDVSCDISRGLQYTWTLFDSAGRIFPLPPTTAHQQSLKLQSHFLPYDTYTARARVQVISSVVYSNYTVRIQVIPSPPVAFIQGGTNIFIDKKRNKTVTLDGRGSYDPDFPLKPLSYSWTCKPVSTITSSCFDQDVPTSSPEFRFPISLLKQNFDQFKFTLTVHGGEGSSSSETFLTLTPDLTGKVSVSCHRCRGERVNWDESFSVSATCDDCSLPGESIQYTWSLFLVNASSKPVTEVPFCYTADLGPPFAIMENRDAPTLTSDANASQYNPTARGSVSTPSQERRSETKSEKDHVDLGDDDTQIADLSKSEPSTRSFIHNRPSRLRLDETSLSGKIKDPESSSELEYSFPFMESDETPARHDSVKGSDDYDVPFPAEEGDPGVSTGRLHDGDVESFILGEDSVLDSALNQNEGSNLVDPKPGVAIQSQTLLDLHRDSVDRSLFESYSYTGISSDWVRFKPFSLQPRTIYLLEVTAKSQNNVLGRTQLFLKTNPAPEGIACQVQPAEGMELYTHFSIFCTSGREDLLYKYSFSVRGKPPRILYQGRDFQYYFSLPSGDPSDDYKVTVYIEIRSGRYGSATRPCPVTVQVKPSFLRDASGSSSSLPDPGLKLSESGLKNLSALVQLGNSVEIRNYISLLSGILNRLSRDTEADEHAQRRVRNALICTMCELHSHDQMSAEDNILILNDLLQVASQVTLMSARRVTSYVQAFSERFSEFTAPDRYNADHRMLDSLIRLLSHSLRAVTSWDHTPETSSSVDFTQTLEAESPTDPSKKAVQLVEDILQAASDLMVRHILLSEIKEQEVSTGFVTLHAASQNQSSTVFRSGFTTIYMPASLIRTVFDLLRGRSRLREQQPCVIRVLTELSHSPYFWASYPTQSGPNVDLSLFKCNTRRRIHLRSLSQPISIELQHPQRNRSCVSEYPLLRSQINYHNFSITPEHLHQAIQVTVRFTLPPGRAFPIMLLFRMFERPTPSMHHLQRIHKWERKTVRITLLPSYLNAAGVGHLALLNADFEKANRRKQKSEQISYSLTVDSSLCLSWDGQQGAWTHHGCRTQQADTSHAVNCSCYQLRPVTLFQQQIESSHDTADVNQFVSVSSNLTVLGVLVLFLSVYILGLVGCKKADIVSQENRRVHYLSDNNPSDSYLYAVCLHTGLCSAACMTAKVYVVLCGDRGVSQTKELQVPGCTLFRRNSQDTFILSSASSLGSVWGLHIWHDNSGPSADWYLKQVVVSEMKGGQVEGRSWRFVSECWLAVNESDGRVERMLHVCGVNFTKMLRVKFSDFLADFHMWMSVYSCPWPHSFTQTQRLSVCLLLLAGYACANAVIIAQTDDQLPFDLTVVDMSADSLAAGLLSVAVVLPAATLISVLFRLRGIKLRGSEGRSASCRMTAENNLEEAFSEEPESDRKYKEIDALSVITVLENKDTNEEPVIQPRPVQKKADPLEFQSSVEPSLQKLPLTSKGSYRDQRPEGGLLTDSDRFTTQKSTRREGGTFQNERGSRATPVWCLHLAWALCLLLSLLGFILSVNLGTRFSSSKVLLWIQSLFVSLISCIFFIQPTMILAGAFVVCFWHKKAPDFLWDFNFGAFRKETLTVWSRNDADQPEKQFRVSDFRLSHHEKQLRAHQRARHLRLVRPPAPSELRKTRGEKRREDLIRKTLRDLCFCAATFLLMTFITHSSSFKEHYQLHRALKTHFTRNNDDAFVSITKAEDWWKWTQTRLIDLLYRNESHKTESHIVIGDLSVKKTEKSNLLQRKVPLLTYPRTCDHVSCCLENVTRVDLGHRKSDAATKLKLLYSSGWPAGQTVALEVQLTLYSPAPNLFTSVSLLAAQSPSGVLLSSVKVQSVRLFHTAAGRSWVLAVCQLLFLFLSLLQLCYQTSTAAQRGLMGYMSTPSTWLDVSLLAVTLVYHIFCIYHSITITAVLNVLQRHNRGLADVGDAATCERYIRSLRGTILFLVTIKSVAVFRVNRVFALSLSSLLWPTVSGLILLVALSCLGNLLYVQSSWSFSSLLTLLGRYRGLRASRGLLRDFSPWGVLFLTAAAVWTAVIIGAISSSVRSAKNSRSRINVVTTADLFCHLRKKVSKFTGHHRQTATGYYEERRTVSLEELESSVDELLFRLDALSDNVHCTLLPSAHFCRERGFPVVSLTPLSSSTNSQDSLRSQMMLNKPSPDSLQQLASHLFRCHVEQETQKVLQQRSPMRNNHSDITEVTVDGLKIMNPPDRQESTSCRKLWVGDVSEKQAKQRTGSCGSCWFGKTDSEMVVEVLVHKEQGTEESDICSGSL